MEKKQCINPAVIQEGDLLAYLYGEAEPHIAEHIARCPYCAEQVEQMRMVDSQLFTAFYRESCPSPEVLSDFVLRRLPDPDRLRVAAHIRQCPQCAAEVAAVMDLEDTTSPSLLKRLQKALTLAIIVPPVQKRFTPVRGQSWQGRFEREQFLITVSSQPDGITGRVRMRETVEQQLTRARPIPNDVSGETWLLVPTTTSESGIYHSDIDTQGRFHFATIPPGNYTLLLRVGEQNLTIQTVQVL